jgi:hypothetical protein
MKHKINFRSQNFLATCFLFLIALALAGCGGGGGGGATAPSCTGQQTCKAEHTDPSITFLSKTITDGSTIPTTGSVSFTYGYSDAVSFTGNFNILCGTSLVQGSTIQSNDTVNKKITFTVSFSNAPSASSCTISGSNITAITGTKTSANSSVGVNFFTETPSIVLNYSEKIYAIWTGAYPFLVTRQGVTAVTNRTRYLQGFYPLFNCWMATNPLSDGKILASCQNSIGINGSPENSRHLLYINPVSNEIYEYNNLSQIWDTVCGWCNLNTLNVPSGVVWRDTQAFDPVTPTWSAKVEISDGWFFTTNQHRTE